MTAHANDLLAQAAVDPLRIEPDLPEVLRCVGYPRDAVPPSTTRRAVEQALEQAMPVLRPRGTFALYRIRRQTPRALGLGGQTISGHIGEFLQGATRIAAFGATAGAEITGLAAQAWQAGDVLTGWALDAIGSWAAEAATDALMCALEAHCGAGEGLTMRYSPGYCGMDLSQQRAIFALARPEAVGIGLLPSLLMQPMKSVSGLVGIGPIGVVGINLSPCEKCPQVGCHMRR